MKIKFSVLCLALLCSVGIGQQVLADDTRLSLSLLNGASSRTTELSAYSNQLKQQIERNWQPEGKQNVLGVFGLVFQIRPDGSLLNASILKPSGVARLDRQAVMSVKICAPFPPPPLGEVKLLNVIGTFYSNSADQNVPAKAAGTESSSGTQELDDCSQAANNTQRDEMSRFAHDMQPTELMETGSSAEGHDESLKLTSEEPNRLIRAGVDKLVLGEQDAYRTVESGITGNQLTPRIPEEDKPASLPLSSIANSKKPIELSASHGYADIGVLGFEWELLSKRIIKIFPGSDLLNYGITPGDKILAEDGLPISLSTPRKMRGAPGTFVQVTVLHQGQVITAQVQRKDAADFAQYHSYYKHWASKGLSW